MAGFLDFLFGEGEKTRQFQNYTPEQRGAMNQSLSGAQQQLPDIFSYLQNILSQDPEMMKQFEAPAMRQFNEEIIPGIAERFSGMDAQRSNAFGQSLGKAGASLSENLAAQRGNQGSNAIAQLMQLLQHGSTQQFDTMFQPRQPGFLENMAYAGAKGLGTVASTAAKGAVGGLF